jgi:hypothetical protein
VKKYQNSKILTLFYFFSDIDCKNCGSNFSACVISGQSLFLKEYVKCKRCKHKSLKTEITSKRIKNCKMCHTKLNINDVETNNFN